MYSVHFNSIVHSDYCIFCLDIEASIFSGEKIKLLFEAMLVGMGAIVEEMKTSGNVIIFSGLFIEVG